MALVLNDRVKVNSTAIGTSQTTFAIDNTPVTGFETFNTGVGVGNTTYYCIFNQGTDEFEVGLGTISSTTNLQRTTIISSSNSDSVVDFQSGNKDVFCTLPAIKTMDMVLTTTGDVPYASAANTPARLGLGIAGQVLKVNAGATAPEWVTDAAGVTSGFVIAMSIAL
jgi:hypothetical protein